MPRPPIDDIEDDDDASTDSDDEYDLEPAHADRLAAESGLTSEMVRDLWKSQRGLCRMCDLPLTFENGRYDCRIAPRVFAKPISEKNAVMVASIVYDMRAASQLSWTQFVSFVQTIATDEF